MDISETVAHAPTLAGGTEPEVAVALAGEFERLCARLGVPSPAPTRKIGDRYRIEQSIGQGAMGVVFRAWDERLDRRVAVKLVNARSHGDVALMQARLEREAQMLARVDHRNVVGIHDVGSHTGQVYLDMQYVPGVTVRAWLKAQRRSHREILDAYLQAARGLEAAHAGGVVHRDFKPDNVIFGEDGIVRVLDFGIASALQLPENEITHDDGPAITFNDEIGVPRFDARTLAHLTRTGAIMGTLAYMAPEQLRAEGADERSDQFAFCVALWEALVGHRPFDARTPLQYHLATELPPLDPGGLPRWLRPILSRGLSHDAEDRFASMTELIAVLEQGIRRRQRIVRATAAMLGLPSALMIGWLLAPSGEPHDDRETCAEFAAQVDDVWTDSRRAELHRHAELDAKAVGHARNSLDSLGEGWRTRAETLCDDEFAPARDDPDRVCMQTWLTSFDQAIALLIEHGDLQTLVRAPELLVGLSRSGDFCERAPSQPVDPEVARLVREAREAATIGDTARAAERAEQALSRANQQLDGRTYTPELAEAHLARAEVAARANDFAVADAEFATTEQQAIGASHWSVLLPMYMLRAKAQVVSGFDTTGESSGDDLDRALAFADSLGLAAEDLRRVELIEARGLVARLAGRQAEAIEHHRRARARFEAAHAPVLAAKSLNNIGANQQELGELEQAAAAYREAADLLGRAGVSDRHPILLDVEFNLGLLAVANTDFAGLRHLQHVARFHPSPVQRIRARNAASVLAYKSDQLDLAVELSEQTLVELAAGTDVTPDLIVEVELVAGVNLASKGDPRGEPLVQSAERRADELSVDVQLRTRQTWIDWLEQNRRCADARARREALDAAVRARDDFEPVDYDQWRADQDSSTCHSRPGE